MSKFCKAVAHFIADFFTPRSLITAALSIGFILPIVGESLPVAIPLIIGAGLIGALGRSLICLVLEAAGLLRETDA